MNEYGIAWCDVGVCLYLGLCGAIPLSVYKFSSFGRGSLNFMHSTNIIKFVT